ncbi:MAG: ArsA family ATPase [Deltaproteobacteria bacterium]|nr:ArsA family ATPase [Deltaproteobacteria bacterium]MBW2072474.1 ArsA family ATPase [Deltaproteobacteria bacterium]
MRKVFFFLGKGGVGKTTLAGSFAAYLAETAGRVFAASIDPAHNLFDFLGIQTAESRAKVSDTLIVEEFDVEGYLKKFLRESSERMKDTYRYLQMINLENMFDVLKHSPGMEEYAMLAALHHLFNTWSERVDYIVIDTPPTGLMLRIFALPKTSLMWLTKLRGLRNKILSRRAQIVHIKGKEALEPDLPYRSEDDAITRQLAEQENLAQEIWSILSDQQKCKRILVLNYDELSVREGTKIITDLDSLGIEIDLAVFNKKGISSSAEENSTEFSSAINGVKSTEIPFFRESTTPRDKMFEIATSFASELV